MDEKEEEVEVERSSGKGNLRNNGGGICCRANQSPTTGLRVIKLVPRQSAIDVSFD